MAAEPDMREAKRQALAIRIFSAVEPRFGTAELAASWYRSEPLAGFDGLTAMDLVKADRGEEVLRLIEAVDAGAHA